MRGTLLAATLSLGVAFAAAIATPAFAADDPTVNQIYEAAKSGHLDQAQTMITQVLADHPDSARAHYVQAELYARRGKTSLARSELAVAERINPSLSFATPRSVQELKAELGLGARAPAMTMRPIERAPAVRSFPWGTVLILALVAGVLFSLFRRRNPPAQYPAGMGPGAPGGPGYGYGPGYGPAPMGGGIGSGIAGGLASGLAVGAGVVAGEELAHHFLDGGRRESGGVIPSAEAAQPDNSDMGGSDFGFNDSSSWDDGGGSGGGDDWS